jgi:hypothetical protein
MKMSRHISWEQLSQRIGEGVPFVQRVPSPTGDAPAIDIRVAERGDALALWIPCAGEGKITLSPLAALDIRLITTRAGQVIEISTRTPVLFQEIYGFFVSVTDKIQLHGTDPFVALEETVDAWRELLKALATLSEEAQLGLRGELYFLRMLASHLGDRALTAWAGPQRQPHDFRAGKSEFEVKTTRGVNHVHVINGLGQLQASPGRSLYVFSMRMAPAGTGPGTTLPDDIAQTRGLLTPTGRLRFGRILRTHYGYLEEHADWYPLRLQLAAEPYLIPVDSSCPRITADMLSASPHMGRLSDVRYRANFEGLGFADGSPAYDAVLSTVFETAD